MNDLSNLFLAYIKGNGRIRDHHFQSHNPEGFKEFFSTESIHEIKRLMNYLLDVSFFVPELEIYITRHNINKYKDLMNEEALKALETFEFLLNFDLKGLIDEKHFMAFEVAVKNHPKMESSSCERYWSLIKDFVLTYIPEKNELTTIDGAYKEIIYNTSISSVCFQLSQGKLELAYQSIYP